MYTELIERHLSLSNTTEAGTHHRLRFVKSLHKRKHHGFKSLACFKSLANASCSTIKLCRLFRFAVNEIVKAGKKEKHPLVARVTFQQALRGEYVPHNLGGKIQKAISAKTLICLSLNRFLEQEIHKLGGDKRLRKIQNFSSAWSFKPTYDQSFNVPNLPKEPDRLAPSKCYERPCYAHNDVLGAINQNMRDFLELTDHVFKEATLAFPHDHTLLNKLEAYKDAMTGTFAQSHHKKPALVEPKHAKTYKRKEPARAPN